jgi:hypothetical protein
MPTRIRQAEVHLEKKTDGPKKILTVLPPFWYSATIRSKGS